MLGLTTLTAMVSLHAQVLGLFGEQGLLPLGPRVVRLHEALGDGAWTTRPTLLFLTGADDGALVGLCVAGELAAILLMLGVLPGPSALACWAIYLSFVNVGTPFLPLQWDTLLCEALVLGAVVAPWRTVLARPSRAPEPAHLARWAVVLLVARLMLASGIVKLAGDAVWRDLTALSYHYETQPLPGPLARWADAMPMALHRVGAAFTFVCELAVPFLFFAPGRARRIAVGLTLALQLLITLTGNYGFFNLLAATLCVMALDDALLDRATARLPARWRPRANAAQALAPRQVIVPSLAAAVLMILQLAQLATSLGAPARPEIVALLETTDPYRLSSSYGLFADMTTERPELVIEGSLDGETWVPYELPYKPGSLDRALPLAGTHMPRLDWMLWFAALNERHTDVPWLRALQLALLERRAPVLGLFEGDPFEGEAPRFVRIVRWDYSFAPPGSGRVWERRDLTLFAPVLARR